MLINYLKMAWKVLLRRKFFTFISLFGISFTLMILLVLYALFDNAVGPHSPEKRADQLLFINQMQLTYQKGGQQNTAVGYAFLTRYVRSLRTPAKVSVSEQSCTPTTAYASNRSVKLARRLTDVEFWHILDFNFLQGRPYTRNEVRDAARVAVISESASKQFFGNEKSSVGRILEADGVRYRVVGVVQDVSVTRSNSYADFWAPITTSIDDLSRSDYQGKYQAIVLARSPAEVPAVQEEYDQLIAHVPVPDPKKYSSVHSYARTLLATVTARFDNTTGTEGGVGRLGRVAAILMLLFLVLPTVNLVNVNVSRIIERSSEIGVRKAFGATSNTLIGQFLVENIFLTLLGSFIGLGLAAGVLALLNNSHFIPHSNYSLNGRVFGVGMGIAVFFGIMSGVYPAYKMSKLSAIQALKGEING